MSALHSIRKVLDIVLRWVVIALFAAMVFFGTYQICTRYFLGKPSSFSEELLTYMFGWMALLAGAYVFGKRDHMRMGFLADKLKGAPKLALEVVIELMILAFSAIVLVYGGISIVQLTWTQVTASLGIPMGLVYLAVPITGVCIIIYNILNLADMVSRGNADAVQPEHDREELVLDDRKAVKS